MSFGCLQVWSCLLVGWHLTTQSVSQRWICSDSSMCCHTHIQSADQAGCITQLQYTDTGPTSQMDLLRQFYALPHPDTVCRSGWLYHPVTVYWHRANQSDGSAQTVPCAATPTYSLQIRLAISPSDSVLTQGQPVRWICSDSFMRCHTHIQFADQAGYITQWQCTDTGPTSQMDLLRQFHALPHPHTVCRSGWLYHPVTVYWHRANQSDGSAQTVLCAATPTYSLQIRLAVSPSYSILAHGQPVIVVAWSGWVA